MTVHRKLLTTWTISASALLRYNLRDLDERIDGRPAYLRRLYFRAIFTPTFTAHPGVTGHNNLFKRITVSPFGGSKIRAQLSGNDLRMFERLENGRHVMGEAIQTASASPRHFVRTFGFGPLNALNEDEFAVPAAGMKDGSVEVLLGALTDISADTTAMAGTIQLVAEYITRDGELTLGPVYERRSDAITKGDVLVDEMLLCSLALGDSSAWGAIAAGDFADLTVDVGRYYPLNAVPSEALTAAFNATFKPGMIDGLIGEPEDSTDVHQRQTNLASPTAIAAQTADLQVALFGEPYQKLTKMGIYCPQAKTTWSGSQSTAQRLVGRVLPQDPNEAQRVLQMTAKNLGVSGGTIEPKLLGGGNWNGPAVLKRFLPWAVKTSRA